MNDKIVLTYYYTGMMDKWHHKKFKKCDVSDFDTLYKSVNGRGYDFVTLANECNRIILDKGDRDWRVIGLEGDLAKPDDMSLYVHKFIACYEWLKKHPEYEEIWIVDSADTEMLSLPEPKEGVIYTGYDAFFPEFNRNANFYWFLGGVRYGVGIPQHFGVGAKNGKAETMYLKTMYPDELAYNCGVFGGKREIVMKFLEDFSNRLLVNDIDLEMVPFNYLCYTKYAGKVESCTTRMTLGEKDYNRWWRHK